MTQVATLDYIDFPLQSGFSEDTLPPDWTILVGDNASGMPAHYFASGDLLPMYPNRLVIADQAGPNDSGAFNIDVSGATATSCLNLEVIFALRSLASGQTFDIGYLFYNADFTVANYRHSYEAWSEAAGTPATAGAATPVIATTTAPNSPTAEFSMGRIWIPCFQLTTFNHKAAALSNYSTSSTALGCLDVVHRWTTTAITALRIRTDNHPTDTWHTDSRVIVIGHKV